MERLLAVGIGSHLFMKRNNADFVSLLKTHLKKTNLLSNYSSFRIVIPLAFLMNTKPPT